jgi:GNAT superfamily N-acetyltransferase
MTPSETFNARFNAWWAEAGLEDVANVDYERRDATHVYLDIIESFARAQGHGRRILQMLCQIADETGVTLTLSPVWQDEEVRAPFSLTAWYERSGFAFDDAAGEMVRPPLVTI